MQRPSRARRRFHTDRIVAVRRARMRNETPDLVQPKRVRMDGASVDLVPDGGLLAYGRMANSDPWDCGKTACALCNPRDRRRGRERQEWRTDWEV
jgi:hypothetical protein